MAKKTNYQHTEQIFNSIAVFVASITTWPTVKYNIQNYIKMAQKHLNIFKLKIVNQCPMCSNTILLTANMSV